jgi:hypothetical protein
MVLPRNLYEELVAKINDEHVFSLFNQRENANSLYEQCGLDREILKSLKYPYCIIELMNNYVIHNSVSAESISHIFRIQWRHCCMPIYLRPSV